MISPVHIRSIICLLAIVSAGCTRHVEYSVKNTDIEQPSLLEGVHSPNVKVLRLSSSPYASEGWRVHSDQVRMTLPQFSGANQLLSVVSGGDVMSDWIVLRLEFERYAPLQSGTLTPVFNPRLHVPCNGWTVEVKGRAYPVDPNSCGEDMEFGSVDRDEATLQFQVPGGPANEFKVHSPHWRIDWTLISGAEAYPQQLVLAPPDVIFQRRSKWGSLDIAIR